MSSQLLEYIKNETRKKLEEWPMGKFDAAMAGLEVGKGVGRSA